MCRMVCACAGWSAHVQVSLRTCSTQPAQRHHAQGLVCACCPMESKCTATPPYLSQVAFTRIRPPPLPPKSPPASPPRACLPTARSPQFNLQHANRQTQLDMAPGARLTERRPRRAHLLPPGRSERVVLCTMQAPPPHRFANTAWIMNSSQAPSRPDPAIIRQSTSPRATASCRPPRRTTPEKHCSPTSLPGPPWPRLQPPTPARILQPPTTRTNPGHADGKREPVWPFKAALQGTPPPLPPRAKTPRHQTFCRPPPLSCLPSRFPPRP